jgi:Zn-dependent protease
MQSLSFQLGVIPVRVHPSFFLTTALMNIGLLDRDLARLLVWMIIVFGSVLLHELGHAAAGLAFGLEPAIDLHGMGGTTSWSATRRVSHAQRIVISLAGPGMGLAVGTAVLLVASRLVGVSSDLGQWATASIVYVNIVWSLFNLLPMLPLDGGNVLLSGLDIATRGRGARPAHFVSLVAAVGALVAAFLFRSVWCGLLALLFAVSNWQWLERNGGTSIRSR